MTADAGVGATTGPRQSTIHHNSRPPGTGETMKTTYRTLAYLVAFGVVVQAAAIAYAYFGLGKWIEDGGVLDKATMESEGSDFAGVGGFIVHGIGGEMIIPAIALLLLIVSFFARIPGGVLWAVVVVALTALQVALGLLSSGIVGLGMLHGINALALFAVAAIAGYRVRAAAGAVPGTRDRTGVV